MTVPIERPAPPPPAAPARPVDGSDTNRRVASLAGGAALLVVAAFVLLDALGWWVVPQPITVVACSAAIIGAAVLYEGFHRRRAGALRWVAVALLVLAAPVTGRAHDELAESAASPVAVVRDWPGADDIRTDNHTHS